MEFIRTPLYTLQIGAPETLLVYKTDTFLRSLDGPVFEVDGQVLPPEFSSVTPVSQKKLNDAVTEYRFDCVYTALPDLTLGLILRIAEASPVLKFKYTLSGNGAHRLTGSGGNKLDYCAITLVKEEALTEVRFSEFNQMLHSFCMNEVPVKESCFANSLQVMGPLLAGSNEKDSFLLAYEHGSQYPDAFIEFCFTPERKVILSAKKGNYIPGVAIGNDSFETIWLDFGAVHGSVDDLAAAFREFQLKYATLNLESRKPYIFYNTWCYQERNKWYNRQAYLSSMTEERMMAEVEAAHEMGIDVFVIDTGWYEKTGDHKAPR